MTTLEDARDVPEALRLADWIDSDFNPDDMHEFGYDQIATELRRLHAEVEALRGGWRPIETTPDWIEDLAQSWDGCMYDAPGEMIDIGASIRKAASRATPPAQEDGK